MCLLAEQQQHRGTHSLIGMAGGSLAAAVSGRMLGLETQEGANTVGTSREHRRMHTEDRLGGRERGSWVENMQEVIKICPQLVVDEWEDESDKKSPCDVI